MRILLFENYFSDISRQLPYFSGVGHSKTIDVMDSICEKEENETTALLKRDYVSFAC